MPVLPTRWRVFILFCALSLTPLLSLAAQPPLQAHPGEAPKASAQAPTDAAQALDPSGAWTGAIELPNGALEVRVELSRGEQGWTGAIDIPQQGAKGLPLEAIEIEGTRVRFSIRGVPGNPTFDGTLEREALSGLFTQGPAKLSFTLERTDRPAPELVRPQTPHPPFPYRIEEVTVDAGAVTLAGTLTVPAGDGPFPGIVLVTGSGAQDRDETLMGHKPFWVLADHLSRHGIAVLRLDDRGVGGSNGQLPTSSLADLAGDARAAVSFLASRPEVADDRVGLLGHSEGGVVAPLAAAAENAGNASASPAFLVLLAGPGVPGREMLQEQLGRLLRVQGVPESLGAAAEALVAEGVAQLLDGADEPRLKERLTAVGAEQTRESSAGDQLGVSNLAQALAVQLAALQVPHMREFLQHDPRPVLRRVTVPVLAVNGDKDLQVNAERNLNAIGEALRAAGNEDVTTRVLAGLNHLFQHATTGNPMDYAQIEETMSPELLDLVAGWIDKRFGAAPAVQEADNS